MYYAREHNQNRKKKSENNYEKTEINNYEDKEQRLFKLKQTRKERKKKKSKLQTLIKGDIFSHAPISDGRIQSVDFKSKCRKD